MKTLLVLFATVVLSAAARDRRASYGNVPAPSAQRTQVAYGPPQPTPLQGAGASFSGSFQQRPQQQRPTFASASASAQSSGPLSTQCQRQEVSPGRFKFVCDGVAPEARTLRSEHILWLTSDSTGPKVVDIEVPNYKIEELIKAGYKTAPGGDTQINVLLKKPEQSAEAQVAPANAVDGSTIVNLQYEPAGGEKVHFPNDRQYSQLSGPISPPYDARGGRFQRENRFRG